MGLESLALRLRQFLLDTPTGDRRAWAALSDDRQPGVPEPHPGHVNRHSDRGLIRPPPGYARRLWRPHFHDRGFIHPELLAGDPAHPGVGALLQVASAA